MIADIRRADEAAGKLRATGAKALGVQADVVSEEDVDAMASAAEREFGGFDGLFNNAGLFTTLTLKPFDQSEPLRDSRRLVGVSQAIISDSPSWR